MGEAVRTVLENEDLVGIVLAHADIDVVSFVRVGRVCKAWRRASRGDGGDILMAAARKQAYLTKTVFAGLFALSSCEANAFPHRE